MKSHYRTIPPSHLVCMVITMLITVCIADEETNLDASLILGLSAADQEVRDHSLSMLARAVHKQDSKRLLKIYSLSKEEDSPEVRLRLNKILETILLRDKKPGFVGIGMQATTVEIPWADEQQLAILVTNVIENSPAARAGLQVGDAILSIDDQVTSIGFKEFIGRFDRARADQPDPLELFSGYVQSLSPGDKVVMTIVREAKRIDDMALTLGEIPHGASVMTDEQERELQFEEGDDDDNEPNIVLYEELSQKLYLKRAYGQLQRAYEKSQ